MPARRAAPSQRRLSRRFFARDAPVVARALLGKRLVHGPRSGIIVETEAYLGPEDAASHARFGSKKRNQVMFGPAGFSYVYLCYGVHEMFNVVTGQRGDGQAVLIRAIEVAGEPGASGRGPGKLTRALALDRRHNAIDLTSGNDLFVAPGRRIDPQGIATSPRIGVDYAGQWAERELRFFIEGHPSVSGKRSR